MYHGQVWQLWFFFRPWQGVHCLKAVLTDTLGVYAPNDVCRTVNILGDKTIEQLTTLVKKISNISWLSDFNILYRHKLYLFILFCSNDPDKCLNTLMNSYTKLNQVHKSPFTKCRDMSCQDSYNMFPIITCLILACKLDGICYFCTHAEYLCPNLGYFFLMFSNWGYL